MTPAVPLHPYQRRWFLDRARFKIGMFARQTGKTFTTTLEIVDDSFEAEASGTRARWVILSRGERQAREAMEEGVKKHARAYNLALSEFEGEFRAPDGTRYQSLEVALPGGSRITALPANPDTARGFSANVFLDEFAFHQDSRAIWGALFPVISKPGLKLRITSTPNGKGNKFYDIMTAADDVWSRHTVDIYRAVADGLDRDVEALRAGIADADLWAQEYECIWVDEAAAWLHWELISNCESDLCVLGPLSDDLPAGRQAAGQGKHAGCSPAYQGGPCYVGVDIAARNDLFVIWVGELVGDVLWTREIIERRRVKFAEQDWLLDEVFRRYRVLRSCMDQTGMGEKPVEDAQRRHGVSRVEGVQFTAANKLALATAGKELFEDRRIRIPAGMPLLRADLHSLKKEAGPTGTPRFVVEDEGQASHADRAWAGFLAASAAKNRSAPMAWTPAPQKRSAWDAPEPELLDYERERVAPIYQQKGAW